MLKLLLLLAIGITNLCYAAKKAPDSGSITTVYSAGDIADCRTPQKAAQSAATAKLLETEIAQNPSAFILTLGDHTYPVGLPEEFETCYESSWGKFKDRTYPAPGNHEYYSPSAYGYFQYFGNAAGSQQQPYYSFNKGNWHFIALDSNLKEEQQQAQLDWLKQDLDNNRSGCTLAFWHHPLYSSGLHGNNSVMKTAWKMLMDAKADLVLAAHDHSYERFAPQNDAGEKVEQGIRSIIVGTGGASLKPVFWKKQHSEVLDAKTHGILKLNLKKQSYTWEFLPVKGSEFTDKGSAVCYRK